MKAHLHYYCYTTTDVKDDPTLPHVKFDRLADAYSIYRLHHSQESVLVSEIDSSHNLHFF
jgi:hypothetical protein